MRRRTLLLSGCGLAAGAVGVRVTESRNEGGRATALVAGSLQTVAGEVDGATAEAHGSLAAAELVRSGARDPDALALAAPGLVTDLAGWHAAFATNALTVVYDPESEYAPVVRDDWRAALAREAVSVGRTDPARDPLGYRTLLALELAGREGAPAEAIRGNAEVFPETQLLRALEAGGLDAAFAYRNMAVAHDLPHLDLSPRFDLSDPALADHYRSAAVTVGGETIRGEPIEYGAAYLTDRGRAFHRNLVGDAERLREYGFGVPDEFPVVRGRGGESTVSDAHLAEPPVEHGRDNR
ncbi:extracellular solute-binding protein [Halorussus gelatinilyticus]|uniref:Extracellular solute-binding protein n=1 Tax=Halorussus gelatinilyticus TaxID=2937524 RepID=A0A8U0IKW1_9EURY|nr:extracellular solute-binding protein [Halorussus gelatinilyticus]UPW01398.1 extracellular solute-binding protein [Halorussus gelatinilyticus]